MTTLADLLKEIDIDVDNLDYNNNQDKDNQDQNKVDTKNINFDEIKDEGARKIAKALYDERETLINEVSKQDIMLNAMKDAIKAGGINNKNQNKNDNKDKNNDNDDDLDETQKELKSLREEILTLKNQGTENIEKNFVSSMTNFIKENPNSVRYVKEMDELLEVNPSLRTAENIPRLFKAAKAMKEGRDENKDNKKTIEDKKNKFRTESSGISGFNTSEIVGGAKTMSEAFEMTEKLANSRK